MSRSKWVGLLGLGGLVLVGWTFGVTTPAQYRAQLRLSNAEQKGDRLFHSAALGQDGLSCADCHIDSGRFSHHWDGQKIPALAIARREFPRVDAHGHVITLETQINQCLIRYLKGKPLAPSSNRLGLLDLYLRHLSRFHAR
jgi:cytochrome c